MCKPRPGSCRGYPSQRQRSAPRIENPDSAHGSPVDRKNAFRVGKGDLVLLQIPRRLCRIELKAHSHKSMHDMHMGQDREAESGAKLGTVEGSNREAAEGCGVAYNQRLRAVFRRLAAKRPRFAVFQSRSAVPREIKALLRVVPEEVLRMTDGDQDTFVANRAVSPECCPALLRREDKARRLSVGLSTRVFPDRSCP
jgi:hypothetical protein